MNRPEEQLHRVCADLLRLYEARGLLAFCHVPNGGGRCRKPPGPDGRKRRSAEAGILWALGVRAGVSDLLIFLPDTRLLMVELKAATRNLSPAQRTWHATIAALGHRVSVCRSIGDMQAALGAEGVPAIATVNAYHQKAHCGLPDERMEAGKKAMRAPNFGDTGA